MPISRKFLYLIAISETTSTRFWVLISNITAIILMSMQDVSDHRGYEVMTYIMPIYIWASLFGVTAVAYIYGLATNYYSKLLMVFEPLLSVVLWTIAGVIRWYVDGHPDLWILPAIMSMWLLIRYPTHWDNFSQCMVCKHRAEYLR